jgi:hypothetical protein
MNDDTYDKLVETTVNTLTDTLNDENIFFAPDEIIDAVMVVAARNSTELNSTLETYLTSLTDVTEFTNAVRDELLLSIAEERPGTNPWDHEPTIPMPVIITSTLNHALSVCAQLALHEEQPRWVQQALDGISEISTNLTEQLSLPDLKTEEMNILFGVGLLPVHGYVIKLPQPGIANTARFLEAVVSQLQTERWAIPDDMGINADNLAAILAIEAARLRNLTSRFGKDSGPTQLS